MIKQPRAKCVGDQSPTEMQWYEIKKIHQDNGVSDGRQRERPHQKGSYTTLQYRNNTNDSIWLAQLDITPMQYYRLCLW